MIAHKYVIFLIITVAHTGSALLIAIDNTGAYVGFLRGDLGIHAACREQGSCEPLLGGFGGMAPQENF